MRIVGIRFKRTCRVYDFDALDLDINVGDKVIVETEKGMDIGWVVSGPVQGNNPKRNIKKIIRKADSRDMRRMELNKEWEKKAFTVCKKKIEKLSLHMKLIKVEYLFDGSKAVFYFISEKRVDFRYLVKELASKLHTRIEMKQIGVRDATKFIGGMGSCGEELCCSRFLLDFEPVSIKMAKEQNLAINPSKISGVCGRLMCCIMYEHSNYKRCMKKTHSGPACDASVKKAFVKTQTG